MTQNMNFEESTKMVKNKNVCPFYIPSPQIMEKNEIKGYTNSKALGTFLAYSYTQVQIKILLSK